MAIEQDRLRLTQAHCSFLLKDEFDGQEVFYLGAASIGACSALRAEKRSFGPMAQVFVKTPNRIAQNCPLWCWAASTAMIFAMNGHPVDQETIIQKAFGGGMVCATGSPKTITQLLSSQWTDKNGSIFQSSVSAAYDIMNNVLAIDNNIIVEELENNRQLLYCNKHHAMVVVSANYFPIPMGPNVQAVGVLDPFPYSPAYHPLNFSEMVAAHKGGDYCYLAAVRTT